MSGNSANKKDRSELLLGHTPAEALNLYGSELTTFEMTELLSFETIYTIGSYRVNKISDVQSKDGLYIAHVGE